MTLIGFIILLIIAAVVGSLGQSLAGYSVGGCITSIVVGFIGAFLGVWLVRTLRMPAPLVVTIQGESIPLLWSIIGATLFCLALGLLRRRRRML